MEAVSQVVLRNEAQLPTGPLLLVNPPRDGLAQKLLRQDRPVRCITQDFGDFRWLRAAGVNASFEAVPALDGSERLVILNLAREKERLGMLLHAIADQIGPAARLWLVGENRAGIKSSPRRLQSYFRTVMRLDSARHCGLFTASEPIPESPFVLDDYVKSWSIGYAAREVLLRTLPGVFAQARLDRGTSLLLSALEPLGPAGRILDFGCGSGVVALALLSAASNASVHLVDSSALAIESSRRALAANGLSGTVLPSDGLREVNGLFDWIVSNPPFHRGVHSELDTAADFFHSAGTFLTENGKIVIVFNRHLPYQRWLEAVFDRVERLAETDDFVVLMARNQTARLVIRD